MTNTARKKISDRITSRQLCSRAGIRIFKEYKAMKQRMLRRKKKTELKWWRG